MLKCKHQCHCTCSSQIWTCIINDAGRQAAQKKTTTKNTRFWSNLAKLSKQKKKKNFPKNLSSLQALSNSAYKNIATLLHLKAEMLGKKVIK
jgi:hypothetical protein